MRSGGNAWHVSFNKLLFHFLLAVKEITSAVISSGGGRNNNTKNILGSSWLYILHFCVLGVSIIWNRISYEIAIRYFERTFAEARKSDMTSFCNSFTVFSSKIRWNIFFFLPRVMWIQILNCIFIWLLEAVWMFRC